MKLTPAQKQYLDIKNQYKDSILFFRMGDFYEVFYDDAKICAKVLDIALTSRDRNSENPIPMAGIPFHSVDKYLPKLLESGYKVAIAEQVGDVVPGKVVERKVIQIITPGTYVKEEKSANYILAIYEEEGKFYISWGDISIGIFHIQEFDSINDLQDIIFKIFPRETIFPINLKNKEELENYIAKYINSFVSHTSLPFAWKEKLQSYLASSFDSYGKALDIEAKQKVLALLLDYLETLSIPINILKLKYEEKQNYIYFDSLTIKNLEIFQSSYDQDKKNSLFSILDKTITSMGSRLLKDWFLHPINDLNEIKKRQDHFDEFINLDSSKKEKVKKLLKQIYDIERLSYLIQFKQNSPFHWLKLKISLNSIKNIYDILELNLDKNILKILDLLNTGLNDGDFTVDKDFIKDGFSEKIDELRKIAYHSDKLIIDYQQELSEKLEIPVKIKYVNNQGYLIEVSKQKSEELIKKLHNISSEISDKFSLTRKQTLKIAERYTSEYLKYLENNALDAAYSLQKEEKEILNNWKSYLHKLNNKIEYVAKKVAEIDIYLNLGEFFRENSYIKPEFTGNKEIKIIGGRHPVIEKFLDDDETFIENDLEMNASLLEKFNNFSKKALQNKKSKLQESLVHIITGPNMGGKSTYLRQNALILYMGHCGLFVPAKKVNLPIVSGIFARVGSGDVLVKKQSTFMTEMVEVANILNNADENSFIIFDELGRGTSTYDGMAISQAVIEYIVENLKSKTLFATHYHELIDLEKKYPLKVKNFSVGVYENNGEIIFLKKILPGGADKSYGIYVAKLAGLPKQIIERAKEIEEKLGETKILSNNKKIVVKSLFDVGNDTLSEKERNDLENYKKIKELVEDIDINNITPLQALEILDKLRKKI